MTGYDTEAHVYNIVKPIHENGDSSQTKISTSSELVTPTMGTRDLLAEMLVKYEDAKHDFDIARPDSR